eukprot:Gb_37972 [translate_table: standard]
MAANGDADLNPTIILHRKTTIYPARPSQPQQCRLSVPDLQLLCCNYIQKGLLYAMPTSNFEETINLLQSSLSEALVYFYPLAGRLSTSPDKVWYIDCNDSGAEFIEASAEHVGLAEILVPDVPPLVRDLFALNGALNLEGRFLPLLVVQVTKLSDGIAIGCTLNHSVADGTSFWHFMNCWAQLCRGSIPLAFPPVHDRSLAPDTVVISLDLESKGRIHAFSPPILGEKIFHFSKEMICNLKDRANRDTKDRIISSFQALTTHVWQAITRARRLGPHDTTNLRLSVNCRGRLVPPLPSGYFSNAIQSVGCTLTAGELLGNGISFSAGLLHGIIDGHRDDKIREIWQKVPTVFELGNVDANFVLVGSSPRFSIYENDFGWGQPIAVRSGCANKFDGKINLYPGCEGGGSVDLEISLLSRHMDALEIDPLFLDCE